MKAIAAWLSEVLVLLAIVAVIGVQQRQARADYVTNHVPGGHGPLSAESAIPTWGVVDVCCTAATGLGERWLGNEGGSYWAYPSPLQTGVYWIRKSSSPGTYAVAYEFAAYPWGRSYVVTPTFTQLSWPPRLVSITYRNFCPLVPGEIVAHPCGGNWTPMDGGGLLTYVVANGIVKPGLPYGDYLHAGERDGAGSWCDFKFSDFPGLTRPPGAANEAIAVDACD